MALLPRSSFFGYREPVPVRGGKRRGVRLPHLKWGVGVKWFHFDLLGPIPYDYVVYSGTATDAYPADFTMIPFISRAVICIIKDHAARAIFTLDGVNELDERVFDIGFVRIESMVGFKIRNAVAGMNSQFQIIPTR